MRVGVQLPHTGPTVTPDVIVDAARRAEAAGVSSLSAIDRLIFPLEEPESIDGSRAFPPGHQTVIYDPLDALLAAALVTERVELLTAVLDVLFQPPVVLARRIAGLDQFSNGRVVLGIGQGWMREEFATANVPFSRRGNGFDEHVAAMRAVWGPDPVSYEGRFYEIAPSQVGPKPVQPGGPPIFVGAFSPAALRRTARWADGWLPVVGRGSTIASFEEPLAELRKETAAVGRDDLRVRLRCHTLITSRPIEGDRIPASGTVEQIVDDLALLEKLGVEEVTLNQTLEGVPFSEQLDGAAAVIAALT